MLFEKLLLGFFYLLHNLFLPLLHDLVDLFVDLGLVVLDVELSYYIDAWAVLHDWCEILDSAWRGIIMIFRTLIVLV